MLNVRSNFPILKTQMNGKPLVYLDSASSAQKPHGVIDAMNTVMEGGYSNIHRGLYTLSQDLTRQFEAVRSKVANFIGAESEREIIFTRNTTEAINLVAHSWGRTHLKAGDEIILTAMEHHANIVPWQLLQSEIGFTIKILPVLPDGSLDMAAYESMLSNKTKFVGCVHVCNATGVINNVNKIISLARKLNPETKVLIDGTQSVVHMPINVQTMDADFFTFTGHKLYGPTGIGILYGKYDVLKSMPPYQGGGDMIEKVSFEKTTYKNPPYRFEAGTPAITEVIGLGAAVDMLVDIGMDNILKHEADLSATAHDLIKAIPGITLYGTHAEKIGILSFTIDCAHTSDVAMVLDQMGIAVRTGHHCCMPLMQHFGIDGTVRASLALYNNKDDIDRLIVGLQKVRELFA